MGNNGDFYRYFIKLLIRNIVDFLIYEVPLEETERFKNFLYKTPQNDFEMKGRKFFCFKTKESLSVSVSTEEIQFVHFLWEKIDFEDIEDKDLDRDEDIYLYFRNNNKPYSFTFDEPEEASSLHFLLDSGEFEDQEFFSFIDVNGEEVNFNLDEITLVEFKTSTLNEGSKELKDEMKG